MPWAIALPIVMAIVGALGSAAQARAANSASQEQMDLMQDAVRMLGPAKIARMAAKLTPQIRAQMAATVMPAMKQNIAANIAKSGLTGAPAAFASNAASLAPEFEAFQQALDKAIQIQTLRAGLTSQSASMVQPNINPVIAGGTGAARAFMASYAPAEPKVPSGFDMSAALPNYSGFGQASPPNLQQSWMPPGNSFSANRGR